MFHRTPYRFFRLTFSFFILATLFFSQPSTSVYAANFTVTTLEDTGIGTGSLREAILLANNGASDDVITFSVSGTIQLLTVLPSLNNNGSLTINGGGTITVTRNSANNFRIFNISSGANVTLDGLTISNGTGSGIQNAGTLQLRNSIVENNTNNFGGGITNLNNASLTLLNSTVRNNTASSSGGGIDNSGTINIVNSTIYGNQAASGGGGIYNAGSFASGTIINSTITGNTAVSGGGGVRASIAPLTLYNSVVANNTGSNATDADCRVSGSNGVVNAENTLIESGLTCVIGTNLNNLTGDPNLSDGAIGRLGYFPLRTGSVAINAGNNARIPGGVTTDQAGNTRIFGGTVDMGAVEKGTTGASLTGTLTLQGRNSPPTAAHEVPVTVKLTPNSGGALVYNDTATTTQNGVLTITDLPTGTFQVWIKNNHTLASVFTVTLGAGANNVTLGTLREGDADNNNLVNILDFSLLATAFGKGIGEDGFNPNADFNEDDLINVTDFSLLATNFGQLGAP